MEQGLKGFYSPKQHQLYIDLNKSKSGLKVSVNIYKDDQNNEFLFTETDRSDIYLETVKNHFKDDEAQIFMLEGLTHVRSVVPDSKEAKDLIFKQRKFDIA